MDDGILSIEGDPIIDYGAKGFLGLEDHRVLLCKNRGEDAYREDHPSLFKRPAGWEPRPWQPPHNQEACEAIQSELHYARISLNECDDYKQWFIPNDRIYGIMTPEKILAVIKSLNSSDRQDFARLGVSEQDLALQIRYGGGSGDLCAAPCVKVLAILIYNDHEKYLFQILQAKITDKCLPATTKSTDKGSVICKEHKGKHSVEIKRTKVLDNLCGVSHFFCSPYIKTRPGKHIHLVLDSDDVLPFTRKRPMEISPTVTSQHDPDTRARVTVKGEGGFGEVYEVEIDSDNLDLQALDVEPRSRKFALKRLLSSDRDSFNLELASMLPFQEHPKLHVIRILATFEVLKSGEGPRFYFLFPLAEGNLWDFFKFMDRPTERVQRADWVAEQCFKLATALRLVHNERAHHIPHYIENIPDKDVELYGRHGDIKGDNVLYFESRYRRDYRLELADFGLGRLHTGISRSIQNPKGIDNSSTYRAPEFDTTSGKISRKADIFSLGCMFLEIITWLLEGFNAAQTEFSQERLETGLNSKFTEDTFFSLQRAPTGEISATRKARVTGWIKRLRRCSQASDYTDQFLDFIDDRMLVPEPEGRATSREVCSELKKMYDGCRIDSFTRPRGA